MTIPKRKVQDMYQEGAKYYDLTTVLFRLVGLRMRAYRLQAIGRLALKKGDIVVELGCGTGLNFPLIMERIGHEGKLIGVDLTPGMLDLAQSRVNRFGWKNVELVQSDIAAYTFPDSVNGVLATGLFGYIPEYDQVIKSASQSLVPGGHLSILDGKQPENLPSWLFKIVLKLGKPFGYTTDYFTVRPWESVGLYLEETTFETMYGGMIYISSGVSKSS